MNLVKETFSPAKFIKIHNDLTRDLERDNPHMTEILDHHFHPEEAAYWYVAFPQADSPKLYQDLLADRPLYGRDLPDTAFMVEAVAAKYNTAPAVICRIPARDYDPGDVVRYEARSISTNSVVNINGVMSKDGAKKLRNIAAECSG